MRRIFVRPSILFLLLCLTAFSWTDPQPVRSQPSAKQAVGIAVVQDGPSWLYDDFTNGIMEELSILAGDTHEIRWLRDPVFNAGWNQAALRPALEKALADPRADMVLSVGILTTALAARADAPLSKPVIGGYIPDGALLHLPYSDTGYSTKNNLSFVVNPRRITDDVRAFQGLIGFERLDVLVDANLLRGLSGIQSFSDTLAKAMDVDIHLLPMGPDASSLLESLPRSAQAVYLTPALTMSDEHREQLVHGLNARGIPTFSLRGRPDVESGVLAGLAPGDMDRFARRIALNIQQLLLGQGTARLPVLLQEEDALTLNARTADHIGFSPALVDWTEATWLDRPGVEAALALSLEQAMLLAMNRNISLDIERSRLDAALRDHDLAHSRMLPQASGQAVYQRMDQDRAKASLGLFPEDRTTAGVTVRQMIFDDAIISAWKATDRLAQSQARELESQQLDVLAEAGQRYLQLLSAQALLRIDREILDLTQTHRRMAVSRRQIGISGPEDVFRWESETAKRKSALLATQTRTEQARIALNQTLDVDQNTQWNLQDIIMKDEEFYLLDNGLAEVMRTVADWKRLQEFFVQFGLDLAPEIKALEELKAAQGIERDRLRRRFTTPSLHAQFSYDRELDSTRPGAGGLPFPTPEADRNDWTVGVAVSLPLFEGGGRMHALRKADDRLRGLSRTMDQAEQLIAQRIKTALFALQSSHPNIRLTREAARLAHETLRVVQDKYARGTANILDLLDAQNQVAIQDQAAALAVYGYLSDLIECQRAVSWFEATKSAAEREELLEAVKYHMSQGDQRQFQR
jgi:outer membrane protein